MASNKYFLFRSEEVTEFSDVFTNDGANLSVLSVSTDKVAYLSAKRGAVVIVFNNAGLYDAFQGDEREALIKTRMEISCEEGREYALIKKITQFITTDSPTRRVLEFDSVRGFSAFDETSSGAVSPLLPKQPVIMSTQAISNDPASLDLTQTTTTTIAGIRFTSPSLMPIIDYNEDSLTSVVGQPVGSSHAWNNAGTGGVTYHITGDTGTPTHVRAGITGSFSHLRTDAVSIASGEDLILDSEITIEQDYTMYFVISTAAYTSFGSSIIDDGAVHIGFGKNATDTNLRSSFYVRHDTGASYSPAEMRLDNTDYGTADYQYPDPKLDDGIDTQGGDDDNPQSCYVFILRRDNDYNMYLHNHTGDVVGYIPTRPTGQEDGSTSRNLVFDRICSGFRGNIARFGVISTDIGGVESSRIAKDLFDHYRYRF